MDTNKTMATARHLEGLRAISVKTCSIALLLLSLATVRAQDVYYFTQGSPSDSSYPTPNTSGTVMQAGDVVSDGTVSLQPVSSLPSTETLSIYNQNPVPEPDTTDSTNYLIYATRSVVSSNDSFSGPITLTFLYDTTQGPNQKLFVFDFSQGQWLSLPANYTNLQYVTAEIFEGGLFGLGVPGPVATPALDVWSRILLLALFFIVCSVALRKRRAVSAVAGLMGVVAGLVGLSGVCFGDPQISVKQGNPPTTNTIRNQVVTVANPNAGVKLSPTGPVNPGILCRAAIWTYNGSGDPTDPANWGTAPGVQPLIKGDLSAAPYGATGATTVAASYDYANYPLYNCAAYALRGGAKYWIDPQDAFTIIQNEYQLVGAATAAGNKVGDVVTYRDSNGNVTHYAVVSQVDNTGKITQLTSKWGWLHLMNHSLTQVPNGTFKFPSGISVGNYGTADKVYRKNGT